MVADIQPSELAGTRYAAILNNLDHADESHVEALRHVLLRLRFSRTWIRYQKIPGGVRVLPAEASNTFVGESFVDEPIPLRAFE